MIYTTLRQAHICYGELEYSIKIFINYNIFMGIYIKLSKIKACKKVATF